MELKTSEVYEELAIEWQSQMIVILKEKLDKAGATSDKAKGIAEDFIFDISIIHDQGEIKFEDKSYNPRISFDNFSGTLVSTDQETNLHECAFGSTSEVFGE